MAMNNITFKYPNKVQFDDLKGNYYEKVTFLPAIQ